MKVRIKKNRLCSISKKLADFHTGYIGLTYCPKSMTDEYINSSKEVAKKKGGKAIAEDILNHLVKKGININVADVSGFDWFEIDTPNDLYQAERMFTEFPEKWL